MIRLTLICDGCSAVGPHADTESPDRAVSPLLDNAGRNGWRFGTFGLRCPACVRASDAARQETRKAEAISP